MTKKIKLYNIEVTINGKIDMMINDDYRINIILYTPNATASFKIFRNIRNGRYITDKDLLEQFRAYLESLIYYISNTDILPLDIERLYNRKYNGYKRIFGYISPMDLLQEFKLKYL